MRIRTRKNLEKKNAAIVLLFLIPMLGFGSYALILLGILNNMASFSVKIPPPNTDYFTPEAQINMDILANLAEVYELRMEEYCMPTNITISVNFEDYDYNEVADWHGTDNGALAVGETLMAECLRYKWAMDNNNATELANATRMVQRCVHAFSNMIAAPNGGLGINPETGEWFPGTLSRFIAAPGTQKYHQWMFNEHPRHWNGTGAYSEWRVRLYTSRDEVAGYWMGFASVLKFITGTDAESVWCVERIKLLVDQIIQGFLRTNWLIINGDGTPTGSDLNGYFEGSTWQLTLLRIGATALPEKYASLYNYCQSKLFSMNSATMGSLLNADEDYYAFSFGAHTLFALIMLEDNPQIRYHYIKNYMKTEGFYDVTKYHRNAYFNALHLAFMSLLTEEQQVAFENPEYTFAQIRHDIKDQLWRFYTSGWNQGIRNYNLTTRPHSTRSTSLNPELKQKELDPTKKEIREFIQNSPFGSLFTWIEIEFSFDEEHYLLPRTVSEMPAGHFFWGSNPFNEEGGNPTSNGLYEAAANGYLCVYWIGKAFGIF